MFRHPLVCDSCISSVAAVHWSAGDQNLKLQGSEKLSTGWDALEEKETWFSGKFWGGNLAIVVTCDLWESNVNARETRKTMSKRKQGKQTRKTNNENNGIKIQKQRQWRHHQEQQKTCGAILISGQAAFLAILILSEREDVAAWAQQDPQYCKYILTLLPEDNMSSL